MIQLILKVASRCNLNCSYCYVYNKGDETWKKRPALMSKAVLKAAVDRARDYCQCHGHGRISVCFHGGEPCLIGARTFRAFCDIIRGRLPGLGVAISIQTNGTILTNDWIAAYRVHNVGVGISIDGPPEIHDKERVDHMGRGSYARIARTLKALTENGITTGVICVVPLGTDPEAVDAHFRALGVRTVSYLFPDHTHDTVGQVRAEYGPTPCADFLIPIFDRMAATPETDFHVRDLWNMCRVVMGAESQIETFGNTAPHYFFVETDGTIEGLDALRICEDGISGTPLNVLTDDFDAVRQLGGLHATSIFDGMTLPTLCAACEESKTCAGGHLPHRYSRVNGFDNPSAWCADLKKLWAHIRQTLGVTPEETAVLRARWDERRIRSRAASAVHTDQTDSSSCIVEREP
jgi:uncharacterized protein